MESKETATGDNSTNPTNPTNSIIKDPWFWISAVLAILATILFILLLLSRIPKKNPTMINIDPI